ncbi:ABC transporter ATP-binding protein [Psychrobacter aquimaris]|uniref:ABC transporter ATP-binding protein n=1 Tax=Psychrobacter aquimaris TaxID=292733 RepID=UPI000EE387D2|nr:aliphatic sulfonate ABC transporter ATP-binding protein [Psychrobacter sp.]
MTTLELNAGVSEAQSTHYLTNHRDTTEPFTEAEIARSNAGQPQSDQLPSKATGVQIELKKLSKYYGDVCVLDNLNLEVKPGEFLAIVGRSGCGKSTLLKLIAKLEQVTSGEIILVDNHTTQPVTTNDVRVMFQDARLLPWRSVQQNVQLGLTKNLYAKADSLLDAVGLTQKAKLWPAQLSGGQKQRVAFARALVHQPCILLLDEPLGALDALTRLEMQALIERLWLQHGFTTILVTHDVSEAVQLADRVILLDSGHIAQQYKIDLPRPRERNHAFNDLEQQVLKGVLNT